MSKRKARMARAAGTLVVQKSSQMATDGALATSKVELGRMENAININKGEMGQMLRVCPIGEIPEHKKRQISARAAIMERLTQNGITPKDLENEYQKGYDNARHDLTSFCMQFFYCAAAMASHNLFGFGEARIERLLTEIQRIMSEEISREDIRERCKRETGMDVIAGGFDN